LHILRLFGLILWKITWRFVHFYFQFGYLLVMVNQVVNHQNETHCIIFFFVPFI
jgi:hypothetical protein